MQHHLCLHITAQLLACLLVLAVPDHSAAQNGGGVNLAMLAGKPYCEKHKTHVTEEVCIKYCEQFAELHYVPGTLRIGYIPAARNQAGACSCCGYAKATRGPGPY